MHHWAGLYGKTPSRGDFITRNLPRSFIEPWDQWLQESILSSREQLGEDWLQYFLVTPPWRFVMAPGVCGELAWAGVLIPSVDRAQRYFPLTVAFSLNDRENLFELFINQQHWFRKIEELALTSLSDTFNIDHLEQSLIEHPIDRTPPNRASLLADLSEQPFDSQDNISALFSGAINQAIPRLSSKFTLWGSNGTANSSASLMLSDQLPRSTLFSEMVKGEVSARHSAPPYRHNMT
ncbi:MAG: type VI secretion system-associated protein TagF [Gammaproteobacteria bacterium]|jgi:type VI secretion system protein ImpM|nr:type VI secretion system-associated protein TagF [Gammaproteobacteria bacterium]MBT7306673.1 type VI secretion system-associated protein TagF [Gammaproteobacteria bacterium]